MLTLVTEKNYVDQAYTTTKATDTTDRYQVINSLDVYNRIESLGFTQVSGNAKKKLNPHCRHITTFQSDSIVIGDSKLRLVVDNSHDGSRALYVRLGLYRMVCSNGLMVGTDVVKPYRITHTGNIHEKLANLEIWLNISIAMIKNMYNKLNSVILSEQAKNELMVRAYELRHGKVDGDLYSYDRTRRAEDRGDTLWLIYNRIQEQLMLGVKYRSKRITSATTAVDFNVALNNLVMEYAA